jgi:SagB-type dehydrogenase family enzyme
MVPLTTHRELLKSGDWDAWEHMETDQRRGVPPPPLEKPCPEGADLVDLTPTADMTLGAMPLVEAIRGRRSRRRFTEDPLTLPELSFLLWATQGVSQLVGGGAVSLRTVPSAGARHPFETYLLVNRVEGVSAGLYRYLPVEHKLCFLEAGDALARDVHRACQEQYVLESAITFVWTVVPYRTEWRYSLLAHRVILMDAGHVCQNLYLACEAIGAGACAIGAYHQAALDAALDVDGEEEFAIYVAPVGRITRPQGASHLP